MLWKFVLWSYSVLTGITLLVLFLEWYIGKKYEKKKNQKIIENLGLVCDTEDEIKLIGHELRQMYKDGEVKQMFYYVSLVGFLCGSYIKVKVIVGNDSVVRKWANKNLHSLWCSVYTEKEYAELAIKYNVQVIGKTIELSDKDGEIYENY